MILMGEDAVGKLVLLEPGGSGKQRVQVVG